MPSTYKTPGVYVEEISIFPPSVAQVETAIPAFIGYTAEDTYKNELLTNKPKRIKSYKDFEEMFGKPQNPSYTINISTVGGEDVITGGTIAAPAMPIYMNYALRLYFANGGGPCYICSVGKTLGADAAAIKTDLLGGLAKIKKEDEPTMLLFPDAPRLLSATSSANFYDLYKEALTQCGELGDRVTIVDLHAETGNENFSAIAADFRTAVGVNNLKYGAAYYPYLKTSLNYDLDESTVAVTAPLSASVTVLRHYPDTPGAPLTAAKEGQSLYHQNNRLYQDIKKELAKHHIVLPPSSAMAGIFAMVDRTRGVWKAPANVSLNYVKEPMVNIDDDDQQDMNVHETGKSVNAIRKFTGKGVLAWGARTLAGNDNEWRYISVRRFFNMVEESVKKASQQFVFEPNDANTWVKIRAMVENFLNLQWQAGALAGAKPDDAFYVRVGLGQTMTAEDILEGRMNIEIGMAVVRPAEFIILKFSHKMQES